jgi:hypothetical protein
VYSSEVGLIAQAISKDCSILTYPSSSNMAETAGLVFGGIALASLFTTSVECLDYITLARNHGADFELALVKVELLNCRLGIWGKSLSVASPGHESPLLRDEWAHVSNTVGSSLVGIRNCFSEKSTLEKRYGLKAVTVEETSLSSGTTRTRQLQEIEAGFEIIRRRRQREIALPKKVWWAIHDNKKFDTLVANVSFFIENLERLSDRLNSTSTQERLFRETFQRLQTPSTIELLGNAERSMPSASTSQDTDKSNGGQGHRYVRTAIRDQGRFLMGDVGSVSGRQHHFEDTTVSNSGKGIGGNVTPDAMEMFFK